jgi:hypothetical protein
MTKKRKRPTTRSSPLYGDEAEPLSPPLVDPYKEPKPKRKRRGPYDPYPGWGPQLSEEEFYRIVGNGPVAFTRPGSSPQPAPAAEAAEQKPAPEAQRPPSGPGTARRNPPRR